MLNPLARKLFKEWMANADRWEGLAADARRLGLLVWNPPLYTAHIYRRFLERFPPKPGAIMLLGLNPGPHGMAQTGIPFTDCRTATKRLGLSLAVPGQAPEDLCSHLRRPSGTWRSTYERSSLGVYHFLDFVGRHDLSRAYARIYVANPCPLLFFSAHGENVTPADPILKRLTPVQTLRCELVERIQAILQSRAIVCLGSNATEALGATAVELVGREHVYACSHPARAVPRQWARSLFHQLRGEIR